MLLAATRFAFHVTNKERQCVKDKKTMILEDLTKQVNSSLPLLCTQIDIFI